jgi:hypothetical protein
MLQNLDYMQTPLPLDLPLLLSGICKTKTLSRLILLDNELCGIASFAKALTKNQSLKHVQLNNCQLTDKDLFAFLHHLPSMPALKRLWIDGSRQNCSTALPHMQHNQTTRLRQVRVAWVSKRSPYSRRDPISFLR